ncbi:MAG: hypothetical protein HF981_13880 [Desulfobacteraceae bacterium]|nr:hypothetical protein [Desulfobacteraceae bacterium]MBC2751472.1 hypothetical protein [Desulfobacteraceae bacterium]
MTRILGSDQYHNIFLTTHHSFDTDPKSLAPFQPALPRSTAQADETHVNIIGYQSFRKNLMTGLSPPNIKKTEKKASKHRSLKLADD